MFTGELRPLKMISLYFHIQEGMTRFRALFTLRLNNLVLRVGKKEDTPGLPNVPNCFLSQRNQILCWSGIAYQSWVLPVGVQPASALTSTAEGPGLQRMGTLLSWTPVTK